MVYRSRVRFDFDNIIRFIGKKRLTVIFHIEGDCVVVDKILPSLLVTY